MNLSYEEAKSNTVPLVKHILYIVTCNIKIKHLIKCIVLDHKKEITIQPFLRWRHVFHVLFIVIRYTVFEAVPP